MHTLRTVAVLAWRIVRICPPASWKTAFLCAGLAAMGNHRHGLRAAFLRQLDGVAVGGDVIVVWRVRGCRCTLYCRQGNTADYLVAGEAIWGAYKPPQIEPKSIVDGGANIGMFAVVAHAWFPHAPVVCYEPDSENVAQLNRNLEANGISAKVVAKALWSKEATLYYHAAQSYTGYVDETPSESPIQCVPVDVESGAWLKLDIEGAEYEVLPEVLARGIRPAFISMKIHFNNEKGGGLVNLLERCGYRLKMPHETGSSCLNVELEYTGKD